MPTWDRPPSAPRRRRRWLIALALLLVGAGTYLAARPTGDIDKVKQLQKELFARGLPPEQRKAKGQELRQEMKQLSSEQRSQLFAEGQKRTKQKLEAYFALPVKDRVRHLDEDINRAEQRRKEMAARPGGAAGNRPGGPGPFGAGPPWRPGSSRGPRSAEETEKRRKQMLARTTPEQRAMMDQVRELMDKYRADLNKRRQQRGLPAMTGRGPR